MARNSFLHHAAVYGVGNLLVYAAVHAAPFGTFRITLRGPAATASPTRVLRLIRPGGVLR